MPFDFATAMSSELDRLERELDVRLPPDVRAGLTDPAIHQAFRHYLLDGRADRWDEAEVVDTVSTLIANTKGGRANMTWHDWEDDATPAWRRTDMPPEKPWSHTFVLAGGLGNGDLFFIDVSRESAPIAKWDHENQFLEVMWPSFDEFNTEYAAEGREMLKAKGPPPSPSPHPVCLRCGVMLTGDEEFICPACEAFIVSKP